MGGKPQWTHERFVEEARKVHGDFYDYSVERYQRSHTKMSIRCPRHGVFQQRPAKHLIGQGCRQCGNAAGAAKNLIDLAEMLRRFRGVHGDFYGYDAVSPRTFKDKVEITCPKHGVFWQTPANHATGQGCPLCGDERTGTAQRAPVEVFKQAGRDKHDGRYGYDLVQYKNNAIPVDIECPEHGVFRQSPASHLRGGGCPRCVRIQLGKERRTGFEEFVARANEVHGSLYHYKIEDYNGGNFLMAMRCPFHGMFRTRPFRHLQGVACARCRSTVSQRGSAWLDHLGVPEREMTIQLREGKRCRVDGFDPTTNTAYQFHGDYWHGNPAKFAPENLNPQVGITYGELHARTLANDAAIRAAGYLLVVIWEREWLDAKRGADRRRAKRGSVVTVVHPSEGAVTGTQAEIVRRVGVSSSAISLLTTGDAETAKGWRLKPADIVEGVQDTRGEIVAQMAAHSPARLMRRPKRRAGSRINAANQGSLSF